MRFRRRLAAVRRACATPNTKHWWIGVVDARRRSTGSAGAPVETAFAGDARHRGQGPDRQAASTASGTRGSAATCSTSPAHEDRMNTRLRHLRRRPRRWDWHGTVLEGRAGAWDARGARLYDDPARTAAPPTTAARSAEENWFERTGLAGARRRPLRLHRRARSPTSATSRRCRCRDGGYRIFYEARLDGRDPRAAHGAVRVLIASTAGGGHVGPLLPFAGRARGARRRGAALVTDEPPHDERWDAVHGAARARSSGCSSSASGSGASAPRRCGRRSRRRATTCAPT